MTPKKVAVLAILIGSVVFPLIIVCLLIQAALESWEGSLLYKLLKELE